MDTVKGIVATVAVVAVGVIVLEVAALWGADYRRIAAFFGPRRTEGNAQ